MMKMMLVISISIFLVACENSENLADISRIESETIANQFKELIIKPDHTKFAQLFPDDYLQNSEVSKTKFAEFSEVVRLNPDIESADIVGVDKCVIEQLGSEKYWTCGYVAYLKLSGVEKKRLCLFSTVKIDSRWYILNYSMQ